MPEKHVVTYPAVLDDSENSPGQYTVTFPDVPSAISEGIGMYQALDRGAEALELMLYDEKNLPVSTDLKSVEQQYPHAIVRLITVNLVAARKKVTAPLLDA